MRAAAVERGPGDSALWSRAAQGDHDAFGQLFDRHSGAVYSYLFRLTANGPIRLSGLAGTISAYTGTGQIQATELTAAQASLDTETGLIDARFTVPPRRVFASAHVGAVTIRVPAPGPYRVAASAQTGSVTVAVPRSRGAWHVIEARTGTGAITVSDR